MGSRLGACVAAAAGVLALSAGSISFAPLADAAVCPTVDPNTGAVSPPPAPGVDWTGCNLRGAIIQNADLSGAILTGADMFSTQLFNIKLNSAILANVNLERSTINSADIGSADFSDADFAGMHSEDVTGTAKALPAHWLLVLGYLIGPSANMSSDNLTGADLSGVDLSGALISGFLVGANLTNASLRDAKLDFVGLANANLSGTDLTGAALREIQSGGVIGSPIGLPTPWVLRAGYLLGPSAILEEQRLSGLDLRGTNLEDADFFDAILKNVNLANVNLRHAYMVQADLTGADLFGANATGANWDGARCPGGLGTTGNNRITCIRAFPFSGFSSPRPGSVLRKSAHSFRVAFTLKAAYRGGPLTDGIAAAVAAAHRIRVKLTGPGIHATTAACAWSKATGAFHCRIKIPARVMTGIAHPYHLIAQERPGSEYTIARPHSAKRTPNPATIYFR
jgi:uncharacterized protein YjbI with pentapeptide repeats